jgi:hypothetical protein
MDRAYVKLWYRFLLIYILQKGILLPRKGFKNKKINLKVAIAIKKGVFALTLNKSLTDGKLEVLVSWSD